MKVRGQNDGAAASLSWVELADRVVCTLVNQLKVTLAATAGFSLHRDTNSLVHHSSVIEDVPVCGSV